jgi:DNA polymerase I-like protein with 3'-5' exonuclease and polymerase domains
MDEISDTGFCFDYAGGERLQQVLVRRRAELDVAIRKTIPGWNLEYFTLKKKIKKTKHIEFNPGSRAHIARHLMERRGWKPAKWGKDGRPTLTDKILGPMPWEETQLLAEYFVVDGKLGFLVEGKSSLFSHYNKDDRRIHGRFIHQGTATSRCAHSSPNLSGVPKVGKPYGAEFRSLFGAPDGSVLVGVDASGLETRMLASRMAEFDGGAYAKVVLEADVHEENRKAAGLATRDQAKTFWYAFLYGAKDPKLGQIIGGSKAAGAKLRASFLATLPALKKVTDKAIAGGYVGLDGRVCHAPIQERLALNYRLQEDGAVAMKQAVVLFCDEAERRWGDQVKLCMFAHDELQIEVSDKEIAEDVGVLAAWSIAEAGRRFGLSVALDGDWKVGRTWFDTH